MAGHVNLFQQGHDPNRLQEVEEVVRQRPFVQPVHPVDQLRYRRRATRVSSRRATCQHTLSARFCAISWCVCPMAHLPL